MQEINETGESGGLMLEPHSTSQIAAASQKNEKNFWQKAYDKAKTEKEAQLAYAESEKERIASQTEVEEARVEKKESLELKEAYRREDEILSRVEAREDNQYQRMIADMLKAGINPNLQFGSPASGGGTTTASRKDKSESEGAKDRALKELVANMANTLGWNKKEQEAVLSVLKTTLGLVPF